MRSCTFAITAYLLAHTHARRAIEASCDDTDTLSFVILDIEEAARKCRHPAPPPDTHCESIFLSLLANAPPRAQFADDEQRHNYHLWLVRAVLRGAGAVGLVACLLLAGREAIDTRSLRDERETLQEEAGSARRRYDEIVKTFPPIPTTTDNLRAVIKRYTDLERSSPLPDATYRLISRALVAANLVELEAIEWKMGPPARAPEGAAEGIEDSGREPGSERETVVVHGTIGLEQASNPRQVLAALKAFVDALRLNPGLEVVVVRQPFDVASGKSLKSGSADLDSRQPRSFTVRLTRLPGA
jgi:hypothetical protein